MYYEITLPRLLILVYHTPSLPPSLQATLVLQTLNLAPLPPMCPNPVTWGGGGKQGAVVGPLWSQHFISWGI